MRLSQLLRSKSALIAACLAMILCVSGMAFAQRFTQTNLVSDQAGVAAFTDPNLVNAWGISYSPTGPFWVSDAGTGLTTLYDGTGAIQSLVVTIPPPQGGTPPSAPTGQVFNSTSDFVISKGGKSAAALFLFVTEDGTISGWNPTVDPTNAVTMVGDSGSTAKYKGLAIGATASGNFIYAANFHDNVVEMYDGKFQLVKTFSDPDIPDNYAPFNVQALGGKLYVTFAQQDAAKEDDVPGPGHGFVDVFDFDGNLVHHLIRRAGLNSPWGIVIAPADFGRLSNALLVGNFGNGGINAYNPANGIFMGQLRDPHGRYLSIDGLWGLIFGNGGAAGGTNELFFSAGPDEESHGLFGKLTPVQ